MKVQGLVSQEVPFLPSCPEGLIQGHPDLYVPRPCRKGFGRPDQSLPGSWLHPHRMLCLAADTDSPRDKVILMLHHQAREIQRKCQVVIVLHPQSYTA